MHGIAAQMHILPLLTFSEKIVQICSKLFDLS